MWLLPLVTTFQWLGAKFLTQNLFHEYNKVFKYFQKALIVICAKYVVTFRISCLFSILREAEENLNYVFLVKESGSSFMTGCLFHSRDVLQLREDIEKPFNFAKMCQFCGNQHYKEPKMWLLPLENTLNQRTLNLIKVLNIKIS